MQFLYRFFLIEFLEKKALFHIQCIDPSEIVKKERLVELQTLLKEQQIRLQKKMIGREVNVLFEKPGRLAGQMVGKSEYLHAVHVTGDRIRSGDINKVRIITSETNSLSGRIE